MLAWKIWCENMPCFWLLRIVEFMTGDAQATRKQNQNLAPSRVRHTPSIPYQDGRDGRWERQNIFFQKSESSWWSNIFFLLENTVLKLHLQKFNRHRLLCNYLPTPITLFKNRKKLLNKKKRTWKEFSFGLRGPSNLSPARAVTSHSTRREPPT